MLYDVNVYTNGKKGEYIVELVPDRMRGEVATYDICEPETGKVIVEAGRRITARHIRQIERSGISQLEVTAEYLTGRALARDLVAEQPGEVPLERDAEVSEKMLEAQRKHGEDHSDTLYSYVLD